MKTPEENPVKLAIVGCGRHSTSRVFPCIPRLSARLVGVCDLNEEAARRNAKRFGGEAVYTDVARMLDETKPDGLIVCAGPSVHAELSLLALSRGIPVYTEKPAAPTAEDAWRVAKASEKAGKLCMTGFKYRHAPAMVKTKAIVQSPDFGAISAFSLVRSSGSYATDPNRADFSPFLLDFCTHPIDLICYLGGEAEEVFATATGHRNYAISARFKNGAVGSFLFTCSGSWSRPVDHMEIFGAQGHLITIDDQIFMRYFIDGSPRDCNEPRFCTSGGDSLEETGFVPELRAFVAYLRGEKAAGDIASNIHESARSMEFYEAILRSVRSHRPEKLARY